MRQLSANLLGGLAHGGHAATLRKISSFSRIEIATTVVGPATVSRPHLFERLRIA